MIKNILLYCLGIAFSCFSCKPMPPEYPVLPGTTRNAMDDSFIVEAAYWAQDAIHMSHAITNEATDSSVVYFASQTAARSKRMYQKLKDLGVGAIVVPDTPGQHIHSVEQHILSKDENEMHIEYIRYKVEAYKTIVQVFENEVSSGQFKPIRDYAAQQLPELHNQRKEADSILQMLVLL